VTEINAPKTSRQNDQMQTGKAAFPSSRSLVNSTMWFAATCSALHAVQKRRVHHLYGFQRPFMPFKFIIFHELHPLNFQGETLSQWMTVALNN
jgi:hypothetical protein